MRLTRTRLAQRGPALATVTIVGCALVTVVQTTPSSAQDPPASTQAAIEWVENPVFTAWARVKPGARITQSSETTMGGQILRSEMRQSLIEVKPEKVVIEIQMTVSIAGQSRSGPPTVREFPPRVPKGMELLPADVRGTWKEVHRETLTIAGRDFDCTVYEFTSERPAAGRNPALRSTGTMWVSPDMPGHLVRQVSSVEADTPNQGVQRGTITMTTVSVDLPQ